MRIWTIHPRYLDRLGLQGLWRESIMAKNCINNYVIGANTDHRYLHHPQLWRFKKSKDPISYINTYLSSVYQEGISRGYNFKLQYLEKTRNIIDKIPVTVKQVRYEIELLKFKLSNRKATKELDSLSHDDLNLYIIEDLFQIIEGEIEHWEKFTNQDTINIRNKIYGN